MEILNEKMKELAEKILEEKYVKIISHYDADGITSAAIIAAALSSIGKNFDIEIVSQLNNFQGKEKFFLLLDLSCEDENVYAIDHHLNSVSYPNTINSRNFGEEMSSSYLAYLLAKQLCKENLAHLAIIGMIGDQKDEKINTEILKESNVKIKKYPNLFSATRPLDKALEFSSSFYIPGVTGSFSGAISLLREAGIEKKERWPTLLELSEKELEALTTAITLRQNINIINNIINNVYLIKWFNKIEDAREIAALLNACGRLGKPDIGIALCLGDGSVREKAENIYDQYKHELLSALRFFETKKIEGKNYVILNAEDKIRDSIIGVVVSIVARSFFYKEGTVIIGLARKGKKEMKISARIANRTDKQNMRELLAVVEKIGGSCGGHEEAAGAFIPYEKTQFFVEMIKKQLETQIIRIK